jgi:hypothetical protein
MLNTIELLGWIYDTIILPFFSLSQLEENNGSFLDNGINNESTPNHNEH